MKKVHLLYAITLLSSFLLFQIELIIAKIFLPKFGGSYLVWGACMVFFQFALLAGYAYTHVAIKKFGMDRYRGFHLAVLLLPLLFFPGRPLPEIAVHGSLPLVADIFFQLAATIGLAFFALATISIVTQSWLAHSDLPEQRNPYPLYAISNIGSFLGLLSYPFFFEYQLTLDGQLLLWRIVYFVFVLLYLLALVTIGIADRGIAGFRSSGRPRLPWRDRLTDPRGQQRAYWFLLSAAGCMLFLSVTNVMTYEIAPCPLLWVIPLCLYLLSFVLTFRERPLYPRWLTGLFPLLLGLSILIFFLTQTRLVSVFLLLVALILSLLLLCLFCQHELYRNRPAEKAELTSFYLWISFGGLAGSFFVTWLAPLLFLTPSEYMTGLFVAALAVLIRNGSERPTFAHWRLILYTVLLLFLWPLAFKGHPFLGIALGAVCISVIFWRLGSHRAALCLALLAVMILAPFAGPLWNTDGKLVYAHRNYYGLYRVHYQPPTMRLYNGTTIHGVQYFGVERARAREPLAYYHPKTLAGKVLDSGRFPTGRVGIVGLGVGTLSTYGKAGETIDFFELDPDQGMIAATFAYLDHAEAKLNVIYRDARLALQDTPAGIYDLLVIDAFSGDSVPVHLLTVEALKEYRRCLKPGGVILLHISNRYLDLAPVLFSNVRAIGAQGLRYHNGGDGSLRYAADWFALTWDAQVHDRLVDLTAERGAPAQPPRPSTRPAIPPEVSPAATAPLPPRRWVRPWTDQYSHILTVFKTDYALRSLTSLEPVR